MCWESLGSGKCLGLEPSLFASMQSTAIGSHKEGRRQEACPSRGKDAQLSDFDFLEGSHATLINLQSTLLCIHLSKICNGRASDPLQGPYLPLACKLDPHNYDRSGKRTMCQVGPAFN
jgi:hypothetical protein